MKKQVLALATGVLFATILGAQSQVGVHVGMATSKVVVKSGMAGLVPDIGSVHGINVGIDGALPLGGSGLALRGGLGYSERGFGMGTGTNVKVLGLDLPIGARVETKLRMLEVPVELEYGVHGRRGGIAARAGVQAGYMLSGYLQPKAILLVEYNLPRVNLNLDSDNYNRAMVSGVLGMGGYVWAGPGQLRADVSYIHGWNDMAQLGGLETGVRLRGVDVSVGYAMAF